MERPPVHPALARHVGSLWHSEARAPAGDRELALPSGLRHLVIRLSDDPIRLFDPDERAFDGAVLGGGRATAYARATPGPVASVGVTLRPGAAIFGVPGDVLGEHHHDLADLWPGVASVRDALRALPDPRSRLDRLEAALVPLAERAARAPPAVRMALRRFAAGDARISDVVAESGYSHRGFGALFRAHVGLGPKVWCRVRRFQRVVAAVAGAGSVDWAAVARVHGYCDHSHLDREFKAFAGITPRQYRPVPDQPNHVPVASDSSKRRRASVR